MAKKILIVDDEPDLLDFAAIRVKTFGYDVITAVDGENALTILKKTAPDLILLDVMMPGRDGYEICNEIKSDPKLAKIPIVLFTAKPQQKERLKSNYEFIAADDFILKPYKAEDLLAKIKKFIP
jgi:CheY-like chemotaxis protein